MEIKYPKLTKPHPNAKALQKLGEFDFISHACKVIARYAPNTPEPYQVVLAFDKRLSLQKNRMDTFISFEEARELFNGYFDEEMENQGKSVSDVEVDKEEQELSGLSQDELETKLEEKQRDLEELELELENEESEDKEQNKHDIVQVKKEIEEIETKLNEVILQVSEEKAPASKKQAITADDKPVQKEQKVEQAEIEF